MDRKYRSEAMEPIYENALGNFEVGAITREELEEYERACFVSEDSVMSSVERAGMSVPAYASKA
jgi:DNA-binding transcriptional regulator YiaG